MVLLHQGYLTTAKVFICPSSVEEVNARFPDDFKNTTDPTIANFLNPIIDLKNPRFKQLEKDHE